MNYNELVKNTTAYKILDNDFLSGNLSHAYMFVSSDKLFLENLQKVVLCRIFCKAQTNIKTAEPKLSNRQNDGGDKIEIHGGAGVSARRQAAMDVFHAPCFKCAECLRILNQNHPDVVVYPKGAKKINVEQISDLIENIYLKPLERDFKAFVLNDTEEINIQAQNKLLKILEEPPKDTYLFLFCKNKFNILNTILSRVKLLETPPFSLDCIYDAVKDENQDSDLIKIAALNSFGSLQRAKELIENKNFKNLVDFCYSLCNIDLTDILNITSGFNNFKDGLPDILSILQLIFRDLLMIKNNSINLVQNDMEKLKSIEKLFSEKALIKLIEAVNSCNFKLKFNCNSQAVFDILCLEIIKSRSN